ncbi:chromosome partition protein Smc [Clostridium saccharobutylicum]|uniref:phage tail tape measure protein n=1 Tax=Clostridium saccharobutylicum TaxID=169679 RepID=UPI00098C6B3E|nr:phage tail tape measure protein [Clostridium saccharobutylicum]OOM17223.1 chromosome partition protein Smc [Clostridium saccharobutylicum]
MSDGRIEIDTSLDASNVKKSLEELEKTFDNASKQIAQSMTDAEKAMNKVKPNPQIANEFTKIGDSVTKTGEKISKMGSSLSTKVTLPVVGALTVATNAAAKFEHEMADIGKEVEAKGENVGQVIKEMSANSIKWSEDFGQSTADINKGLLILEKDGYSSAESMNIMNTALYTARGANEDLFTVIDQLGGSLEAYGQKTDNAAQTTANMSHMADTFAYISNHTKASISSLGEAFSTAGQTAAALGQPMEQTAAAIGILESSNIDASTAATSLKAGLVNLTKPTKNMKKAMQELGLQAFDSNGKMKDMSTIINDVNKGSKNMTDQQKQAAIAMLFGKESLASWNVLVAKGGDYLKNLADSAGNATGEVQHLSDSMKDTPVNKMKEAEASIKAMGIAFGEDVLPAVTPLVQKITELFKGFAELDEGTKKQIINMALMAAAAGPVMGAVGKVTTGIGGLINLGGKLGGMLGLLGTGAEAGEVALGGLSVAGGLAAGAATVLIAGVAGVITYNELLGKSINTSTDDLNGWEKAVNACTGGTIKSKEELQKAGLVYKDFGDGVSDSFKNGIEEATKQYHDFEIALTGANMGDSMSSDNQTKITASINKMIDGAKSAINSRKGEIQNQLTDLFTADGSGIDENEQKVLDEAASGFDEKLSKVDEIQKNISEVWTKAIAEHGKLSQEDIAQIKSYLTQVKQIQAEVQAKNDAESSFAKNQYSERLNGISAKDASKEYEDASKTVKDNFSKLRATYKTGIDDLNNMQKKAEDDFNKAQTDDERKKAQESIENIKNQIEEKTKAYKDSIGKEQSEIREYLDMIYEKNPTLKNNLNEVTGAMFSDKDKQSQGRSQKLRDEFTELANVTKTGMVSVNKPIKDANGEWQDQWHDIYVSFDEATGNITGEYDTFNGEFGGYSEDFEKQAKDAGSKIKAQMEELQKSLSFNGGGVKLDSDNNAINATTDQLITKLDTVVKKADGTKTAIQDINGTKVRLEFDKDGTLTNAQDVQDAIAGKFANNPAVVKTRIEIDGSQVSTIDDTVKKLDTLPKDKKVKININGEEAIMTAGEAEDKIKSIPKDKDVDITVQTDDAKVNEIKGNIDNLPNEKECKISIDGQEETNIDSVLEKLKTLPPDTKTDIVINGEQISTVQEAIDKISEIKGETNTDIKANNSDANSKAEDTKNKLGEIPGETNTNVKVNASQAESSLSRIATFMSQIGGKTISMAVNIAENVYKSAHPNEQNNYTGTNYLRTGLSHVNEHGYETAKNTNVKMISSGMAFLIGHHYTGGDGINDHMTTVNEMHRDISGQVGDSVGRIVDKLVSALGGQSTLLGQVVENTGATAKIGEKSNQLSEKLANDMVDTWSSKDGNFSTLGNEMKTANDAKTKADKMKVEDNFWYSTSKSKLDDIQSKIDALKDKSQDLSDSIDKSADEASKKSVETEKNEIEKQQHVLEKQKDVLEKEVNYYKDAAQKEIDTCKEEAEKEVKIAEEKKEKLTKVAEAVTTAIKNELTQQKDAADKVLNDWLTKMETDYNNSVKALEDSTKTKTDKIDKEIKALESKSEENTRNKERTDAQGNIFRLQTEIKNTASEADKKAFELELKQAQSDLTDKENGWSIEDKKASLEAEKTRLSEQEETEKESLEKRYNTKKKAKEKELKDTDKYYDKLLETDSINAQARYIMLSGNNEALVALLNSYNPKWQDAGQSLADSLIDGLNSKKQSVQDAIDDIMSYKNSDGATVKTGFVKSGTKYATASGFATGTNYNTKEGYYDTNENGFELKTSGDVAYVSKGAGIKNHMESLNYINNEIYRQVAMMQASVKQSNLDMMKSIAGMIAKSTNTSNNTSKVYSPTLHIDKYIQNTSQDTEQLANEFGVMAYRQRVD